MYLGTWLCHFSVTDCKVNTFEKDFKIHEKNILKLFFFFLGERRNCSLLLLYTLLKQLYREPTDDDEVLLVTRLNAATIKSRLSVVVWMGRLLKQTFLHQDRTGSGVGWGGGNIAYTYSTLTCSAYFCAIWVLRAPLLMGDMHKYVAENSSSWFE